MPGWGRWVAVALSLLMTGAAAGCGGEGPSDPAERAERACPVTDPDGHRPRPEPYAPEGTPYDGSGPHLLTLIKVERRGLILDYEQPELPPEWQPPSDTSEHSSTDFEERDSRYLSMVELVVCEYIEETGSNTRNCGSYREQFDRPGGDESMSVPVVETRYSYRVFEATTAEPVAEFELRGGGGDACPSSLYEGSDEFALPEVPAAAEVTEALRPLVTGTR